MRKIYDCDWFESRYTAPKRFRIRRKSKPAQDAINAKLDLLLSSLGLMIPKLSHTGTYAVYYEEMSLFRGSYEEALAYMENMGRFFSRPLRMERLAISL